MKTHALITGASSGIGRELVLLMAAKGHALVLVARRSEQLKQLAEEITAQYKTNVHVIAKDLTSPTAADEIYEETNKRGLAIDILINNAGFGDFGSYLCTDPNKELQMLQLNIIALTRLTKLFLPNMVLRHSGHVMNLASVAAFMPGPYMTVYYATKAFVLSYTEALAEELHQTGIKITAFCPGPVATKFEKTSQLEKSGLFKKQKIADAAAVAKNAYQAMMKGKVVAVNGFQYKTMLFFMNFAPRAVVRKMVAWIQREV